MANRRDQIRMTDEEARAFLVEQKTMICATNGKDGWPHLMPLWYVVRDSGPEGAPELWAWTFRKSQKVKNLERDPRATVQVETGEEYQELRGIMLETDVVLHPGEEETLAVGMEVFARYTPGFDGALPEEVEAGVRTQAAKRIGMQFVERKRVSWDHRKLGGTY